MSDRKQKRKSAGQKRVARDPERAYREWEAKRDRADRDHPADPDDPGGGC